MYLKLLFKTALVHQWPESIRVRAQTSVRLFDEVLKLSLYIIKLYDHSDLIISHIALLSMKF